RAVGDGSAGKQIDQPPAVVKRFSLRRDGSCPVRLNANPYHWTHWTRQASGPLQRSGRSQVTQRCLLIAPGFRPAAAQRAFAGDAAVLTDCAKLPARCSAAGVRKHARQCRANRAYSPNVSRLALPPAAVVLMVTVFSVAKRC